MSRIKDLADDLDRALRGVEGATERAVQRASSYVESSLAKAGARAMGLPAWLALLGEVEPERAPFGIDPKLVGHLDVSTGRLKVSRLRIGAPSGGTDGTKRLSADELVVGEGKAAVLVGQASVEAPPRYLVVRFGPETVSSWTIFADNHGEQLHVRDGLAIQRMSEDDLKASAKNRRLVAPGIGLTAIGPSANHLSLRDDAWRAAYVGRDARGAIAALVFDLSADTERA